MIFLNSRELYAFTVLKSFKSLHHLPHRKSGEQMAIESTGAERGNPRFYSLIENAPKTGKSPTIWAWPQITEYLKVAGQPVQGPWPPSQEQRPDPDANDLPVAVRDNK